MLTNQPHFRYAWHSRTTDAFDVLKVLLVRRRKEGSQDVPDSNFLRKAARKGSTLKFDCLEQPIAAKLVKLAARTAPIYHAMIGWAPTFGHA